MTRWPGSISRSSRRLKSWHRFQRVLNSDPTHWHNYQTQHQRIDWKHFFHQLLRDSHQLSCWESQYCCLVVQERRRFHQLDHSLWSPLLWKRRKWQSLQWFQWYCPKCALVLYTKHDLYSNQVAHGLSVPRPHLLKSWLSLGGLCLIDQGYWTWWSWRKLGLLSWHFLLARERKLWRWVEKQRIMVSALEDLSRGQPWHLVFDTNCCEWGQIKVCLIYLYTYELWGLAFVDLIFTYARCIKEGNMCSARFGVDCICTKAFLSLSSW